MWKMRYYSQRYDTPATYVLLGLMVLIFLFDFFTQYTLLAPLLAWEPSVAWLHTFRYWQAFTFPLVHTSVLGLLFDGLCLYWFGGSAERAWGTGKFLFFFFSSGMLAGFVLIPQTLAAPIMPIFTGMAGSFVGLCVAFAAMNPYATIMFWFIPMQAWVMAAVIIAIDLFGNYSRYGGPIQALIAVAVVVIYAYFFTTRRVSVPSFGGGSHRGPAGPSLKERIDRWQQRRKMRQWQRRVSKIDRPDDLFKDK